MSRDYKERRIIVYPQYLDSRKSRSRGRRIPRKDSIPNPQVDEIVRAAESLELDPIVEEARYPRAWWEGSSRVVVRKVKSKLYTLKLIASKIRELRGLG
ncbi:MAG: signal recognition particle protein Srp19 [Thermoprotei archaeon]|mgnify:CR=1 FL=1|nr:MAG: signal recognition particle protein Srp19 [Thermoprotei archaeon]